MGTFLVAWGHQTVNRICIYRSKPTILFGVGLVRKFFPYPYQKIKIDFILEKLEILIL
nr:MAG TPA: hypothetical protein [Caudoviricetes sp.]